MAECIDKESFLKGIKERYCLPCKGAGKDHDGCKCRACWMDDICGDVIDAPAADVAPVVHGRWIHSRYEDCSEQFELVKCSQCNHEAYAMAFYVRGGNYCPNCVYVAVDEDKRDYIDVDLEMFDEDEGDVE